MINKINAQVASVRSGPSVLIVDDEHDFAETLVKRLERRGFRVQSVSGGQAALDLLAIESFNVVILDVMMPGMDGLETLRELKARWPQIQVILLSGHGGEELGIRGMAYGAHTYLLKPVSLHKLVEIVNQAYEEGSMS